MQVNREKWSGRPTSTMQTVAVVLTVTTVCMIAEPRSAHAVAPPPAPLPWAGDAIPSTELDLGLLMSSGRPVPACAKGSPGCAAAIKSPQERRSPTADERFASTLGALNESARRAGTRQGGRHPLDGDVEAIREHFQTLKAMEAEAQAALRETAREIVDRKLPPVFLERQRAAEQAFSERFTELSAIVASLAKAHDEGRTDAWDASLKHLLAFLARYPQGPSARPTDLARLPFRAAAPTSRRPAVAVGEYPNSELRGEVPSLTSSGSTTSAIVPETDDAAITPAIRDLALQMHNDPVRIYQWVRSHIEWIPTYGSIQGSDLTLFTRRGNSFDTSSLLVALLRAAGISARYVYGTIDVPAGKMMNWVGGVSRPQAAQQLLGQGGIPNIAIVGSNGITAIRIEHVWVEALVDFVPSRGAVNRSGDTWVPLDPSFKQYEYSPGVDLATEFPADVESIAAVVGRAAAVDAQTGAIAGLDQAPLDDWARNVPIEVASRAGNTPDLEDFVGRKRILVEQSSVLAASLPNQVVARAGHFDVLPSKFRHGIRLTLYASDLDRALAEPSLSYGVSLPALAGRRLGVTYLPATDADRSALESFRQSPDATLPVYLIHVVPSVRVDDAEVARGPATTMGETQFWDVQLSDPGNPAEMQHYVVTAGDEMVFGIDAQGVSQDVIHRRFTERPSDTAAENLHTIALYYWAQHDVVTSALAASKNAIAQRLPSIGLFSSPLRVAYLFGIPRSGFYGSRQMDISRSLFAVVDKASGSTAELLRYSGLIGSLLEGRTFDSLLGREQGAGVSAVQLLREANEQRIPIYLVNASNFDQIAPRLRVDTAILTKIGDAVRAQKQVLVPERAPVHGTWSGVGYIIEDPVTGAAAYLINGGLNGGSDDPCTPEREKEPQRVPIVEIVLVVLLIILIVWLAIMLGALAAGLAPLIADAMAGVGVRVLAALAVSASASPALAMRSPGGPGNGMPPPGDCTAPQLAILQAAVDLYCHGTPSCRQFPVRGASCADLANVTETWRQCGLARSAVNTTCFRGGNDGHQIAEDMAYANWSFCLCRMGQNGCL